jgi:hypothetical protein
MGKIIFVILIAMSASVGYVSAQNFEKRYVFSHTKGNQYTALSGSAVEFTLPPNWDDDVSDTIIFPFPFKYQNVTINDIAVETNGNLILNGARNQDVEAGNIFGLYMDYESKNRGKVFHETVGTTPNRIFKVAFQNLGRVSDLAGNDTMNYQIWLYEKDNAIEYRVGFHNVPDTSFAQNTGEFLSNNKEVVHIGLLGNKGDSLAMDPNNAYLQYVLYGTAAKDSFVYYPDLTSSIGGSIFVETSYKKYPDNGDVFRFIPKSGTNGILKNEKLSLNSISPNPSSSGLFEINIADMKFINAHFCIYNMEGKVVKKGSIDKAHFQLDLSGFAKGVYSLHIQDNSLKAYGKLIIK